MSNVIVLELELVVDVAEVVVIDGVNEGTVVDDVVLTVFVFVFCDVWYWLVSWVV